MVVGPKVSPRHGSNEEQIPWLAANGDEETAGTPAGDNSNSDDTGGENGGVELTSVVVSKDKAVNGSKGGEAAPFRFTKQVSNAAKNLKLDLNKWRGTDRAFDKDTRSVVMEILNKFDFDGDGQLEGIEVAKVCKMIEASNDEQPGGGIPIAAFPEKVRDCVSGFDLDGSGYVEPIELVAGAQALLKVQKENRYMKIAIVVFICILVIFCFAIFGLTFAVVKMTEQTTPPSSESPEMYVKGTTEPIRVAATDTSMPSSGPGAGAMRSRPAVQTIIGEDGVTRRLETEGFQAPGSVVQTDSVASYAFLPDLLKMPLEVIDTVSVLTFMTFDGAIHTCKYFQFDVRQKLPSVEKVCLKKKIS